MTIGIIWSLAAKGRLIKKNKYLYLGKNQNKKVNHWVLRQDPPLSEPPVNFKTFFVAPFPNVLYCIIPFVS